MAAGRWPARASIATIRVSGSEKSVRLHVPSDIGELGLKTRSMWWNRSGSPRSSTSIMQVGEQEQQGDGYAALATGPSNRGRRQLADRRHQESPVARLLKRRSHATSPCQLGNFVTS